MKIGISSDEIDMMELTSLTYWKIRERLLRVPGVANVAMWGEQKQMIHVLVDPNRMAQHNVSLDEILQVTSDTMDVGLVKYSTGTSVGTGSFCDPNQKFRQHVMPIITPKTCLKQPSAIDCQRWRPRLVDVVMWLKVHGR
jgi:hypothetical protein